MTRPKDRKKRRLSRIDRLERKCDRILSELLIIRHNMSESRPDLDVAIERMHKAARKLRRQCESEYLSSRHSYS